MFTSMACLHKCILKKKSINLNYLFQLQKQNECNNFICKIIQTGIRWSSWQHKDKEWVCQLKVRKLCMNVMQYHESKPISINTCLFQYLSIILQASSFKTATKDFQFSQDSHIKQKGSKIQWKTGFTFTAQDKTAECQL
jgi:hypothetical protein